MTLTSCSLCCVLVSGFVLWFLVFDFHVFVSCLVVSHFLFFPCLMCPLSSPVYFPWWIYMPLFCPGFIFVPCSFGFLCCHQLPQHPVLSLHLFIMSIEVSEPASVARSPNSGSCANTGQAFENLLLPAVESCDNGLNTNTQWWCSLCKKHCCQTEYILFPCDLITKDACQPQGQTAS